jgi:hypothetical protein
MATGATKWAWENSRASNGSLIVLLAIADECGEGEFTEMKIADLALKCRLSDRAVRMAVKDLLALGELSVEGGRGAVGRYVVGQTSAKSADVHRQNLPTSARRSAKSADVPRRQNLPTLPKEPQVKASSANIAGVEISDILLTVTGSSLEQVKETPAKPPSLPDRPDVERLCARLADRIAANGSNRPVVSKKWRDAARLLIDKDGRTEEQVSACIDWCQKDEFWRGNIMSMPTLREKYDRLRLDALRKQNGGTRKSSQPTHEDYDEVRELARRLDAREGA